MPSNAPSNAPSCGKGKGKGKSGKSSGKSPKVSGKGQMCGDDEIDNLSEEEREQLVALSTAQAQAFKSEGYSCGFGIPLLVTLLLGSLFLKY